MSGCRFLVSVLAISIGVLLVEPFSSLDIAFAQSVDEGARLNQQAVQLHQQGRYAEAEPLFKRALAIRRKNARS